MPQSNTWKVTMIVGIATTVASFFPALVMRLLDFVALYGLILMPMGAVIFADFWILPKLELMQNYAEIKKIVFNWSAAVTWGITLLISILLPIEIFFKALPGWFIAVGLYIMLSYVQQKAFTHKTVREVL
jgi:purine-cytosine permease-like protein